LPKKIEELFNSVRNKPNYVDEKEERNWVDSLFISGGSKVFRFMEDVREMCLSGSCDDAMKVEKDIAKGIDTDTGDKEGEDLFFPEEVGQLLYQRDPRELISSYPDLPRVVPNFSVNTMSGISEGRHVWTACLDLMEWSLTSSCVPKRDVGTLDCLMGITPHYEAAWQDFRNWPLAKSTDRNDPLRWGNRPLLLMSIVVLRYNGEYFLYVCHSSLRGMSSDRQRASKRGLFLWNFICHNMHWWLPKSIGGGGLAVCYSVTRDPLERENVAKLGTLMGVYGGVDACIIGNSGTVLMHHPNDFELDDHLGLELLPLRNSDGVRSSLKIFES